MCSKLIMKNSPSEQLSNICATMFSKNSLENTHSCEFFMKVAGLQPETLLRGNSTAHDFNGLFRNFPQQLFLRVRLESYFWVLTLGSHRSCIGFCIGIFEAVQNNHQGVFVKNDFVFFCSKTCIITSMRSLKSVDKWLFSKLSFLKPDKRMCDEFCNISKNTFFYRTPPVAVSDVIHCFTYDIKQFSLSISNLHLRSFNGCF